VVEEWAVKASTVDEDLWPTMTEREQHQMLLVSTAHRLSTALMLRRRQVALAGLEDGGDGNLLLEWSTPPGLKLDDVDGWRQASPHWTPHRQRLVQNQLDALSAGEVVDPDEPDPEESFKAQWLNQWPRKLTEIDNKTEPLLPGGLWFGLGEPVAPSVSPVFVGMEDAYGKGAGVAVVAKTPDGRYEIDGLSFDEGWDAAIDWVLRLGLHRKIRELHVGASMIDRVPSNLPHPHGAVNAQASAGFAVFRDLAAGRMLVHDDTPELDKAIGETLVRESPSGLQIAQGPRHLIKAVAWALLAAHKPARIYAVR
jgi:hypothetical protein